MAIPSGSSSAPVTIPSGRTRVSTCSLAELERASRQFVRAERVYEALVDVDGGCQRAAWAVGWSAAPIADMVEVA